MEPSDMYKIILDIQKQLGALSRETGEQTKLLGDVSKTQDTLTAYQREANSKMAKAITDISNLQALVEDYPKTKERLDEVLTTKKAVMMIAGTVLGIISITWGVLEFAFDAYLDKKISNKIISNYEKVEIIEK